MPNYATKADLICWKDELTNLESEIDRLDIDKLGKTKCWWVDPVPTDLSKLSNAVKNDVVKKEVVQY